MSRIESEKRVIAKMVWIYCHHKERNAVMCESCRELVEYARQRLSRCPFQDKKSTCRQCPVHCYRPDMAERIRAVMRYSGPRMMLYAPMTVVRHLMRELLSR